MTVIKTSQLRPYSEIIAVCSQIHTKHINTLWAERRISECYSWWYINLVLGYKRLKYKYYDETLIQCSKRPGT